MLFEEGVCGSCPNIFIYYLFILFLYFYCANVFIIYLLIYMH